MWVERGGKKKKKSRLRVCVFAGGRGIYHLELCCCAVLSFRIPT